MAGFDPIQANGLEFVDYYRKGQARSERDEPIAREDCVRVYKTPAGKYVAACDPVAAGKSMDKTMGVFLLGQYDTPEAAAEWAECLQAGRSKPKIGHVSKAIKRLRKLNADWWAKHPRKTTA